MSLYQYYDFIALERPLSLKEQEELRRISTRAHISRTQMTNEYHFGSFKGNPLTLVEDYFDAHLYFANSGVRELLFRVPPGSLDRTRLAPYLVNRALKIHERETCLIIELALASDAMNQVDLSSTLDELLELREEILRGDERFFFLGWVISLLHLDGVDGSLPAPLIPAGMNKRRRHHDRLIEFFEIPDSLLSAALEGPSQPTEPPGRKPLQEWVQQLDRSEVNDTLTRLLSGDPATATRELRHKYFRETATSSSPPRFSGPNRTAQEVLDRANLIG